MMTIAVSTTIFSRSVLCILTYSGLGNQQLAFTVHEVRTSKFLGEGYRMAGTIWFPRPRYCINEKKNPNLGYLAHRINWVVLGATCLWGRTRRARKFRTRHLALWGGIFGGSAFSRAWVRYLGTSTLAASCSATTVSVHLCIIYAQIENSDRTCSDVFGIKWREIYQWNCQGQLSIWADSEYLKCSFFGLVPVLALLIQICWSAGSLQIVRYTPEIPQNISR